MSSRNIEIQDQSEELKELMDEVNSTYGDALTFMEGTSGLWPIEKRIRTGSLALDLQIGVGGWPKGRFNCVAGEESSGKTSLALHTVREAQRQGELAVYIDAENALDPSYMKKIGIDLSQLLISQPPNLENAIDLMYTLMTSEKVGLIVVDSIAALKSQTVMEGDAELETRALEARRWSAQVPRLTKAAADSNTCVLFINQIRDSQNPYQAETQPGGRTLKFAHSTMVKLRKFYEGKGNQDGVDWHEARFVLEKNKVGSPFTRGSFFMEPGYPIDWVEDVILQAQDRILLEDTKYEDGELVSKRSWFTIPLTDEDVELMKQDDDSFLDNESSIALYEDNHFMVRFGKNLVEQFARFPSLIENLEQRILETLNESDSIIDSEAESEILRDAEAEEGADEGDDAEDEE